MFIPAGKIFLVFDGVILDHQQSRRLCSLQKFPGRIKNIAVAEAIRQGHVVPL